LPPSEGPREPCGRVDEAGEKTSQVVRFKTEIALDHITEYKTMKTLIVAMLTLFVAGAALLPDTADARRLGGGKSFGKQYSMPRQAQTPQAPQRQQQANNQRNAQGQAAGRGGRGGMGWLGPLAGLAAGGLLASMFFGGAFEGFQPMDFMLIALLAFGGYMLFRMLRRPRGPAPAGAAAGGRPAACRYAADRGRRRGGGLRHRCERRVLRG
jgi:hypothetical protein